MNLSLSVSEAIRLKRAVRKFTPDPLPEETILRILDAGRRSQSSKKFFFVTPNSSRVRSFCRSRRASAARHSERESQATKISELLDKSALTSAVPSSAT